LGDAFGDEGAELASEHAGAFGGIANEAAFDEDGGVASGVADDVEAGVFGATIGHAGALDEVGLNVGSEGLAGGVVVVGFGAGTAATAVVVVVEADEEGVAVAVADGGAIGEGDEDVAAAGHDDFEAFTPEDFLDAAGGIEGEVLFVDVADGGPAIVTAVASVQDHCVKGGGRGTEDEG
jgi:hypothetical protein